jgi:hypothetical protein
MKNFKRILLGFPEYYLVILAVLAGYKPPFFINPIAIGLIVILILQLIYKNKITRIVIAGFFIVINVYMLLALISEFSEFATLSADALQLLLGGLLLIILNLLVSAVMIFNYRQTAERMAVQKEVKIS